MAMKLTLKNTFIILFMLQIVPTYAVGGKLTRVGSIQFVPIINGADSSGVPMFGVGQVLTAQNTP